MCALAEKRSTDGQLFAPFSFNGAFNSRSGDDFRSPPWTIHLSALRNSGHSLKQELSLSLKPDAIPPRDRIAKAERRRSCRAGQRYVAVG